MLRQEFESLTQLQFLEGRTGEQGAPPPKTMHKRLKKIGFNHVIYTSHSHSKKLNRYRIILPCYLPGKEYLRPTIDKFFQLIRAEGSTLTCTSGNYAWTQPAYLARRDSPSDGLFESYGYFKGQDFLAEKPIEVETYGGNMSRLFGA